MNENDWLYFIVTLPYVIFLSLAGGLGAFIMRLNQSTEPKPLHVIFVKLLGGAVFKRICRSDHFFALQRIWLIVQHDCRRCCHQWAFGGQYDYINLRLLKRFF